MTKSFRERIDGGEFNNSLPYPSNGRKPAARDAMRSAYQQEDYRLKELFKTELLKDLGLTNHPKADDFWIKCWEDGHSSGYSEVYNVALEWAGIMAGATEPSSLPPDYGWLRMHYAGALGLLSECSVQVNKETRALIERAFKDAESTGRFTYSRTLNRLDIEVVS